MLFTDYLDVDQQNMAGWATISLVALNILVNLVTMLYPPICKIYLKCKRKIAPKKKFNKVELVAELSNAVEMV
jgi:ACR3 family arsenite efflux pump ArsB